MFTALVAVIFLIALTQVIFRLSGHSFHIVRIHPFSLRYAHRRSGTRASSIRLHFHLPRPSDPHWCVLTIRDVYYSDSQHQVSIQLARIKLWHLPIVTMITGRTWASVEFDDFRLRVFDSAVSPAWVTVIRRNIVKSVLTGEYLQLEHLKTSVHFGSLNQCGRESEDQVDDIR
jgi:hypothetical protein